MDDEKLAQVCKKLNLQRIQNDIGFFIPGSDTTTPVEYSVAYFCFDECKAENDFSRGNALAHAKRVSDYNENLHYDEQTVIRHFLNMLIEYEESDGEAIFSSPY